MTDDLRTRIAAVLNDHQIETHLVTFRCSCSPNSWLASRSDCHRHLADAVIRELGEIPNRIHFDDQGRRWEWCGGQTGTWAWRITQLDSR